jgi:hypothetical protein
MITVNILNKKELRTAYKGESTRLGVEREARSPYLEI